MKHLEPILAGSKSHHLWDLGGKSLAWIYHLKPVISEISGEKTDNPTDNLPITICRKFGPGKDGGTYRQYWQAQSLFWACPQTFDDNRSASLLHLHSATATSKFIASSRSRPTAWWPGSYVVNVTQGDRPARCPNHFFAVNEPSAVPCFQYHTKTISSSFLSAISIASFIQFFIFEHTKISWWCQIQQNPVNRYGPPQKTITLQKHTRQL